MQNRRQQRTPFTVGNHTPLGTPIIANDGKPIGLVQTPELAGFIVRAANRYDVLMQIFHLARGEMNGHSAKQRQYPTDKAFKDLADELLRDIKQAGN